MKDQLLREIDDLIGILEKPPSEEDLADGWTSASRAATATLLHAAQDAVCSGRALPELSIGRGLDHWGVEGGSTFEKACEVSNHLREFGALPISKTSFDG